MFDALRMKFDGASSSPTIAGDTMLPGKFNFFEGQNPAKWITDVPSYSGVTYRQLYKGVDLTFRDTQGKLERDFVIAAGADPKIIRMKVRRGEKDACQQRRRACDRHAVEHVDGVEATSLSNHRRAKG